MGGVNVRRRGTGSPKPGWARTRNEPLAFAAADPRLHRPWMAVQPCIQYTPTVVVAASSRNGRTPLMPSQGYFA